MKPRLKILLLFAIITVVVSGCFLSDLDKVKEGTITPTFRLPIAKSTFTLLEFFTKNDSVDYVDTDERGVIRFFFDEEVDTGDIDADIDIPNQLFQEFFSLNLQQVTLINSNLNTPDFEFSVQQLYDFTVETEEGDRLDSLIAKDGQLRIVLNSDLPTDGTLSITFPGISDDNGDPVVKSFPLEWDGNSSINVDEIVDFEGLKIDFTNEGGEVNDFKFILDLTLINANPPNPVSIANVLSMGIEFNDIEIDVLYGQFGTRTIETQSGSIDLEFFENLESGNFFLAEPLIGLSFDNGFGIPAFVDLSNIVAEKNGKTLPLTGEGIQTGTLIAAPTVNQVGETVNTTEFLDETNSNLPEFLSILPNKINFDFDATMNPFGATEQNFVADASSIGIRVRVELPLAGRFGDLVVSDTAAFDGEDILQDLTSVLIQVSTVNELPLDLDLQIFFRNANGQIIDELFDNGGVLLVSGTVDNEGNVIEANANQLRVTIDESRAELLESATDIVISARVNTANNGNTTVRLTDSQNVTIKLGIEAKLELTL